MLKLSFLFLSLLTLSLSSCALLDELQAPQLTPLEIQSLQTREYKTSKELVFASVISVFQDLGYTILSADQASGFISAKSLRGSSNQFTGTAFVETFGNMTRVRLSFVKTSHRTYSSYDIHDDRYHEKKYKTERQVLDAELYQNAFEQIESAMFVRSSH